MPEIIKDKIEKFNKLSTTNKLIIIGGTTFLVSVFIVLMLLTNRKSYSPLFYNITAAQSGDVIDFLKKQRVPFKVNNRSGLIEVPKGEVYQLRMLLAKSGFPGNNHIGLEIFDKTKLGQTEFVQHIGYLRAIQGELARSIETIQGIKRARVHIVMPEESLFKEDDIPATASIIITYSMGYNKLSKEQVKAIANLVANSVEGLKPENVKIIDSYGIVLSDVLLQNKDNLTEGVAKKMSYKKNLERYYEKRIQNMLEKVVGKGKVIATVTTDLDFTKKEQTMEVYDPDTIAERSHERVTESNLEYSPKKGGVPGVASNVPSVMAQQQAGTNQNKNIKKSHNKNREIVNYEVSKTVSKVVNPVGSIRRISVAVIVDGSYKTVKKGKKEVKEFVPRSKEEMATLKEVVKKAIGFNVKRNDQVEVSCVPFSYDEVNEIKSTIAKERRNELIMTIAKYALTIIALLIIFLFILRPFLKAVLSRVKPPEELTKLPARMTAAEQMRGTERGEEGVTYTETGQIKEKGKPAEKTPEDIVKEIIEANPDKVAQVVKQWLRSK